MSILYEKQGVSLKMFSEIIEYYGIPYIQTISGLHYPESSEKKGDASMDVLELIVLEAIFSNICKPKNLRACPLYYMCMGTEYEKDECFSAPWLGDICSYKIISDSLGLSTKTIK